MKKIVLVAALIFTLVGLFVYFGIQMELNDLNGIKLLPQNVKDSLSNIHSFALLLLSVGILNFLLFAVWYWLDYRADSKK